jgi:hypothetical protein
MRRVARLISNQSVINKGLCANDASTKNIIGYRPGANINARNVNSGPLCEVALYCTVPNSLIAIGILE